MGSDKPGKHFTILSLKVSGTQNARRIPAVPQERLKIFSNVIFHVAQWAKQRPEDTLNIEVNWAWQELSEIKASRHHLAAQEECF